MSELEDLCEVLNTINGDILQTSHELHGKAQAFSRASAQAAAAARSAEGEAATALARAAAALAAASQHCGRAAQSLVGASNEWQAFVRRTVGGGGSATAQAAGLTAKPDGHDGTDDHARPSLTADQSEFLGAEFRTRAGSAFFYPDDATFRQAADDVPSYPGEYVLDLHGTPNSVQLRDSDGNVRELSAKEFADVVRRTSWNGQPIRLFSCNTGKSSSGFAQHLADDLGVAVTAPTAPVSTARLASSALSSPLVGSWNTTYDPAIGDFVDKFCPGEWRTYFPGI